MFEHNIIMSSVTSIEHISTIALAAATIGFMTAIVTGLSIIQVPWTLSCRARQINHNSSDHVLSASWVCPKLFNEQRCLPLKTVVLQIFISTMSPVCYAS